MSSSSICSTAPGSPPVEPDFDWEVSWAEAETGIANAIRQHQTQRRGMSGFLGCGSECRAILSVESHLLVVGEGLGVLGFGDLSAALIDDRKRSVAEGVVGFELDDLLGVLDRLVGLCKIDVELGEH